MQCLSLNCNPLFSLTRNFKLRHYRSPGRVQAERAREHRRTGQENPTALPVLSRQRVERHGSRYTPAPFATTGRDAHLPILELLPSRPALRVPPPHVGRGLGDVRGDSRAPACRGGVRYRPRRGLHAVHPVHDRVRRRWRLDGEDLGPVRHHRPGAARKSVPPRGVALRGPSLRVVALQRLARSPVRAVRHGRDLRAGGFRHLPLVHRAPRSCGRNRDQRHLRGRRGVATGVAAFHRHVRLARDISRFGELDSVHDAAAQHRALPARGRRSGGQFRAWKPDPPPARSGSTAGRCRDCCASPGWGAARRWRCPRSTSFRS